MIFISCLNLKVPTNITNKKMPKKRPARNAFYFFMQNYREEQKKKGVSYENMAEVAEAAGPVWKDAPAHVRTKFETLANKEKQKHNVSQEKFTSTGIPLSVIQRQQQEQQEAEETQRNDIRNLVKLKAFNQSILDEDFYLIDVNYFCKIGNEFLIAESTVLRFNLREGIKDHYHEMINPGKTPLGYASDVKINCKEYGLITPDETVKRSDYIQILANIIDYLKQKDRNLKTLPPLFTMPDKVEAVQDWIQYLCSRAAEDDNLFRVYKLDYLFFTLINAIKVRSNEGFPKESLAMIQLNKDLFKYNPGLGCEHHEASERVFECTTSRVKRWAFTLLDSSCPVVGVDLIPGRHIPLDYDLDGILTYKEQKKERVAPTVAGFEVASSSFSSNVSLNESLPSSLQPHKVDRPKKERRVVEPMREPHFDHSIKYRTAPELTEDNFPTLSTGMGRGRGLASSFRQMNLKK